MTVARGGISFGESWRVLAYTLVLALAFVALGRAQVALFNAPAVQRLLQGTGLVDGLSDAKLGEQAAAVAAASRDALARAPAGHRLATLRLGYELGYVSEHFGLFALAPEPARERAWQVLAPQRATADAMAAQLGVAPAAALRSGSLREFGELDARYEADESGLAARLEQQLSPWHRHVYLLGVHLGIESARIEATQGERSAPPAALIRRHAALAGIASALWQPLSAAPGGTPAEQTQRYRSAVQALAAALAQQDAASAPGTR
ncbi:MAG TPA: hypothetical protein PKB14_09365 [Rubrivivax sp.]|nr:hypothetical protein [Rubrivivax sp.]